MKVTVFGLGLLGGSFALGLRAIDSSTRVTGVDVPEVLGRPAARLAAQTLVAVDDTVAVDAAIAGADLTLLAAPVSRIVAVLPHVLERSRLVTDCGSTKRAIVAAAAGSTRRGRFVPGHPMAGAPEGGIDLAQPELFRGRRWLICPDGSDADALATIESLVRRLGAEPHRVDPLTHDRAVALTSHATQVVASALAALALESNLTFGAGPAFDSATRVAGGPAGIWRDILASNAHEIEQVLAALGAEIEQVRAALAKPEPDVDVALSLFARARPLRRK
jgi:prephenate dehydrogenase